MYVCAKERVCVQCINTRLCYDIRRLHALTTTVFIMFLYKYVFGAQHMDPFVVDGGTDGGLTEAHLKSLLRLLPPTRAEITAVSALACMGGETSLNLTSTLPLNLTPTPTLPLT